MQTVQATYSISSAETFSPCLSLLCKNNAIWLPLNLAVVKGRQEKREETEDVNWSVLREPGMR